MAKAKQRRYTILKETEIMVKIDSGSFELVWKDYTDGADYYGSADSMDRLAELLGEYYQEILYGAFEAANKNNEHIILLVKCSTDEEAVLCEIPTHELEKDVISSAEEILCSCLDTTFDVTGKTTEEVLELDGWKLLDKKEVKK